MNLETEVALLRKHNEELREAVRNMALQLDYERQSVTGQEMALPVLENQVASCFKAFPSIPADLRMSLIRSIAMHLDCVAHITPRVEARRA